MSRPRRGPTVPAHFLALLIVISTTLLVYANALHNPFVYDDHDTVLANPSIAAPIDPLFVLVHSPFRPVVNVSYAVDRAIWGYRPFGFHLTNLLLHLGVAVLLYALMLRALRDVRAKRRGAGPAPAGELEVWVACFSATAFSVHPMMTESVGYVSGRSELLCGLFFLAALQCGRSAMLGWDRRAEPPAAGGRRWRSPVPATAGALVCALLALLSKEVAVGLPIVLLAYDWLILPGSRAAKRRRVERVFIPFGTVILVLAAYRLVALLRAGSEPASSPHLNLMTQTIVIWRYMGMLVVPAGQSIMHGVRSVTSVLDPIGLLSVAGLAGVILGAVRVRKALPLATLGIIWFFAALAPSSSVVSLREGMAEHRIYLAAAGLTVAFAGGAAAYFERVGRRGRLSGAYFWIGAGTVLAMAVVTVARNEMWGDPVRLWRQAVERAPGMWEPRYALGDSLRGAGECAAAIPEYEAVVAMRPGHRDALTNLGICLAQTNRHAEAESAFRRALDLDPTFVRGYTNLGALAIVTGDFARAREMYLAALEVDPRNVLARMQLARLYETVFEDFHAAARMCGEARAIQPYTPGVGDCVNRNQRLAAAKDQGR